MAGEITRVEMLGCYDVFLNFRGEDMMPTNFTNILFTRLCQFGVNTFKDDDGETQVVSLDQLVETIEGSKISIIIFTKNDVDSMECLNKLVKVLDYKNLLVLPFSTMLILLKLVNKQGHLVKPW
ncbi:disease resistance protein RPV1-like [Capsicum galapagoense]